MSKKINSLEKFLEFEQKNNLFSKKIGDNFKFWMYIRFDYMMDITVESGSAQNGQNISKLGNSKKEKIKNIMFLILNVFKYKLVFPFIRSKKIMIINHPRKVMNDEGFYECKYTHLLSEKLDNSIVIEFPYPLKHYYPTKEKNFYVDYIKIISLIKSKMVRKFKYDKILSADDQKYINNLLIELDEYFDINFQKRYYDKILYLYSLYKFEKKELTKLIKKINPEKIVEVVYYSFENLIVNEIASELNIETIELQHGISGNNHPAYNFQKIHNDIPQLPKKMLIFSDYWKKITKYPILSKNILSVGFPYFEHEILKYSKKNMKSKQKKKTILFVSQASIGNFLSDLAWKLSNIIDNDKYDIIYKLHPGEYSIWENNYEYLKNSNIIVMKNEESMYDLFSRCDIQIGAYSTAIYEGLGFGLHTLIYKVYGTDMLQSLADEGYITYVENEYDIKQHLNNINKNDKIDKKNDFWKKDSLNNILKIIKK